MVYNFFDKNLFGVDTSGGAVTRSWSETLFTWDKSAIKCEIMSNQALAEELHKPIIRNL